MKKTHLNPIYRHILSGLLAVLVPAVSLGWWVASATAADSVTLSGRVYNVGSGVGYAGVAINLCGAGSATTGANGNWQVTAAVGTAYCARIGGGLPGGLTGPVTRNNPEVGTQPSYEYQTAGTNCYHNANCDANSQQWDRPIDGGLDFAYTGQATATPAPTPTPAASSPTPSPSSTPAAGSATTAPAGFQAQVDASGHAIKLSWQAPADPASVKAYALDRSIDQTTWSSLAANLTTTTYDDQTTAPDVHYYYRLSATTAAGQTTDYALADTTTGSVLSAASSGGQSYTSADHLAIATLSDGTLPAGATCTVGAADSLAAGDRTTIAGPYQLTCQDSAGTALTTFNQPVAWTFKLGDKLRGFTSPQIAHAGNSGTTQLVSNAHYDAKAATISTSLPGTDRVAALASRPNYGWVGYVAIALVGLLAVAALAIIPLRIARKQSYQEYLRSKYYNL
ncbi:MAG TPA: hypothetical protein VLI05_06780 [Candidatus Saccharimonadia bacterium]|nr:hypothetical protein [Candidatus Saccharimonadia bacterium]